MFKVLLVLLGLTMSACSHFKTNTPKEFQVSKLWVRSGLAAENLEFRKINRSSPVLIEDLIVQANAVDGIGAYNKNTGRLVWKMNIENGVEVSLAQIRDRLFVAANDGQVYSLEGRTGKVIWQFSTKAENIGALTLSDGTLYFVSGANVLYALDASTGRQLWVYAHQDASAFSIRGTSQPFIHDGMLYAGFSDGNVIAFDAAKGAIKWQTQLNKNKKFRDMDAQAIIDSNQLYIAGFDDKLYVLDPKNGALLWKMDQGGYSSLTIDQQTLFYPTTSGEVQALDKSTGKVIWTYKLKQGIATQVKLFKNSIVFGESSGELIFLDKLTGQKLGGFSPGRGVMATPLIDESSNKVFFISGESNLWAVEAAWKPKF